MSNFHNNWYEEEEFWQLSWEKKNLFLLIVAFLHLWCHTDHPLWAPMAQLARCASLLRPLPHHRGWEKILRRVLFQISQVCYGNARSRVFSLPNLTHPGHVRPYLGHRTSGVFIDGLSWRLEPGMRKKGWNTSRGLLNITQVLWVVKNQLTFCQDIHQKWYVCGGSCPEAEDSALLFCGFVVFSESHGQEEESWRKPQRPQISQEVVTA